jgi:predicted O-linked N-acetylglucosamine transferase (SPINDLY family)
MLPSKIKNLSDQGLKLFNNNKFDEAEKIYKEIIKLDNKNSDSYCALGTINAIRKNYKEALDFFEITTKLEPKNYFAFNNLGTICFKFQKFNAALEYYNKAIIIKPDYINALNMRALIYEKLNDLENSLKDYSQIQLLEPSGKYIDGIIFLTKAKLCLWNGFDYALNKLKKKIEKKIIVWEPFVSLVFEDSLEIQKKTLELYTKDKTSILTDIYTRVKKNKKKIRLGYFSADFYSHAVSLLISRIFELHNKENFEIYGFALQKPIFQDAMRDRIIKSFDEFYDLEEMTDLEVIHLARSKEIDIAIDLTGFTNENRANIFFNRIAPIQINFLGYPGSMGLKNMDYIIGDKILIPEKDKNFYTEKIIYMPNSYQANDNTKKISDKIFTHKELGLPKDSFIFCCFNSPHKITPEIFKTWIKIISKVKNSVLWLYVQNEQTMKNLKKEMSKNFLSEDRIIFAKKMDLELHLARLRFTDLCLDTLPYNGHTTTSDALWAGVPVLTCVGKTFAGKVSASLLTASNMNELITKNLAEYENLAVELAKNTKKLNTIKDKLKNNNKTSKLFNSEIFTKNLEIAYKTIYKNYHLDLPIEDIYIS